MRVGNSFARLFFGGFRVGKGWVRLFAGGFRVEIVLPDRFTAVLGRKSSGNGRFLAVFRPLGGVCAPFPAPKPANPGPKTFRKAAFRLF